MKVKADTTKNSGQLPIFAPELALIRQNMLQNFRLALTHVRLDIITVTFLLVLVILSEPSFHLSRGRNKLGSHLVARTELRKSRQTMLADFSSDFNERELPQNSIDTNALIANSCIGRTKSKEGTFTITGSGGLPNRPGDVSASLYSTGDVRGIIPSTSTSWKKGDPHCRTHRSLSIG